MPPDEAFELKPGDVLANKFRIEQVLGIGGMGIVAAAWHLELRTRVALKLLLPSASVNEAAVERFSREASALSRMRSEYVVRVFDVGRLPDGGPPFMVMEHLVGEDLESLITMRGRIEREEAVGYALHACEGIAEAHSLGIVHRDLKPANLFLTRRVDGTNLVKVVDFGIAKERFGEASAKLTGPLIAMGSPQYMSPEQTRAADVDPRTDIWSLGVCLYEMLTGVPPFDAPSVAEITASVLMNDPRSPEEVRSDLPAALGAIVMRCLRKMPAERFPDVAELAGALEEFAPSAQRGSAARMRLVLGKRPALRAKRAAEPGSGETPLEPPPPDERETQLEPPPPDERGGEHDTPPIKSWSAKAPGATAPAPKRRALFAALALGAVGLVAIGVAWRRASSAGAEVTAATSAPPPVAAPTSEELPPIAIQTVAGRPLASAAPRASAGPRGPHPGGKKPARPGGANVPAAEPDPEPAAPAIATASAAAAPAPRFVVASARVDVGSATHTFGTTATNVNRVIAPLSERMTACYRAALPQMPEPAGSGTLHIETDEDGVIISARLAGGSSGPAACISGAVVGRRLPNVDTGRARADVPLAFRAQ